MRVIHCNGYTRDLLILQSKTKPLDNPKVRQAISMAIDRDTLAKAAYSGFAKGATTPYPSAAGAAPSNAYTFDPEGAKRLLAVNEQRLVKIPVGDPGVIRDIDRPEDLAPPLRI